RSYKIEGPANQCVDSFGNSWRRSRPRGWNLNSWLNNFTGSTGLHNGWRKTRCVRNAFLYRGDETIAAPWEGLNVTRHFGRIVQRLAQLVDRCVQPVVEVHKRVAGPQTVAQLFSCDQRPWLFKQNRQDFERLADQLDLYPMLPNLMRMHVGLKWAELYSILVGSLHRLRIGS